MKLKYSEFMKVRENLLATRNPPPLRMDEFDLYGAMAGAKPTTPENPAAMTPADALAAWARRMKLETLPEDQMVCTRGVKETLRGLFPILKARGYDLWIPEDVYAGYRVIANEKEWPFQTFTTLPAAEGKPLEDFSFLKKTGPKSAVVLVNPLVPLGRFLTEPEVTTLKTWLSESPDRLLILDAIYEPKAGFDPGTTALMKTGQCLLMHSLSKTWISPGVFGVAIPPNPWRQN